MLALPTSTPRPTAASLTQFGPLLSTLRPMPSPPTDVSSHPQPDSLVTPVLTPQIQGLNNAVALDFDYREQMIYWTDVTTQGSMIRRMHLNGSNVQVRLGQRPSQKPPLFRGRLAVSPPTPLNYAFSPFPPESLHNSARPRFSLPETQGGLMSRRFLSLFL